MGMDLTVVLPSEEAIPRWETVQTWFSEKGFPVEMRMINGELAFPEEVPPEDWKEIRIGAPGGMITVRRQGSRLTFVTWGNADPEMTQAWHRLAWGYATLGQGMIMTEEGELTPESFESRFLEESE